MNARSGPIAAPIVSRARWTPNARPSAGSGVDAAMRASRGPVRMPLPSRSRVMTAVSEANPLKTIRRTLVTAESP